MSLARARGARLSACLGLLLGAGGCSGLADGEDSLADEWRCLDRAPAVAGLEPAALAEPARLGISFLDLFQIMPLQDLEVRACLAIDSSCASPVGEATQSDANGHVELTLYRGFDGFLEIRGASIISSLVFLPVVERDLDLAPMGLVPEANLRTFNTNFGAGIDFEKGHLVIRITDCDGAPAENVNLEASVPSRQFFMVGGLPEFMTTRSGPAGVGGFLNIDAAAARVVGSLELADGTVWSIGSATYAIRQGWATFGDVGPRRSGLVP